VADWATIASMCTAGGTLVLGVATFASVRSANRAARIAERSLQVGLRPVLVPSRPENPAEKVRFGDDVKLVVRGGMAAVERVEGRLYLAIALRNVGAGLAVLHGWHVWPDRRLSGIEHADPDNFRRQQLDLYIAPGDTGYWQGALRDSDEEVTAALHTSLDERRPISVELLYGDHEGGQRTISRFGVTPREGTDWSCTVVRHWSVDGRDPRPG
jgi:hypothetical protein